MQLRLPFSLFWSVMAMIVSAQPVGSTNGTDAKGRKQGPWSKAWPNGTTRYTGQFRDDRPVGTFKHFTEEGSLSTVQVFATDGRTSSAKHFHPNGTLLAAGKYLDQDKDSTWNYFAMDGKLRKVERYGNGKLNGEQVSYYGNGTVAESEMRRNGVLEGAHKSWFETGKLKSEAMYVNGEPEGPMVFLYPNGIKEIEGRMVNGDRDGAWYYFNEDGSLHYQVLYAKGLMIKEKKENGVFKEYFDDERPRSEVNYKKGKKEGPFVEYHDNGKWELRSLPADPVLGTPGDVERVLTGQTKAREGRYANDVLEGEVVEYDAQGKVTKRTRYMAGVEQ